MHNLHPGANLLPGAKLHPRVKMHSLMLRSYVNKLCSYVIGFTLLTYHKCFSFTLRRIRCVKKVSIISQFKIPSCEKNATPFGFICFIYLYNI